MSRPRSWCSSSGAMRSTLFPSNRISPVKRAFSISLSVESAVTVLPDADSPTRASFSPASSVNEAPCTTRRGPKSMLSSLTSSRLIKNFPRIQRVAQRIADQDQEQKRHHQHAERGNRDPPRVEVVLALVEQLAEAGRARRHAQVQEIQAGERPDRRGHLEGHQRD